MVPGFSQGGYVSLLSEEPVIVHLAVRCQLSDEKSGDMIPITLYFSVR